MNSTEPNQGQQADPSPWWKNPLNGMLIAFVVLVVAIVVAVSTHSNLQHWLAWFGFTAAVLSIIGFLIDYKGPKKEILNAADGVNYAAFWIVLIVAGIALIS